MIPGPRKPVDQAPPMPDLIARARAGDKDAFARLYTAHRAALLRYVQARVHNRQTAEDLVQEVFVRALRRIDAFAWTGRDIGAWLVTIARNLVYDHAKAGARCEVPVEGTELRALVYAGTTDMVAVQGVSRCPSAEDTYLWGLPDADSEDIDAVRGAVLRLNHEQRLVVAARYWCDLPVAEAAELLGKTVGAVKSTQNRAFHTIRREVAAARAERATAGRAGVGR